MSNSSLWVVSCLLTILLAGCTEHLSQEEKWQNQLRAHDIEYAACRERMSELLDENNDYIPRKEYSESRSDELLAFHNSQSERWEDCALELTQKHVQAVFDACEQEGCGTNIGGGCFHISEYSIYASTIEDAMVQCAHN